MVQVIKLKHTSRYKRARQGVTYVTFGVYIQFPPYIVVSAAFWATLKDDTARVVMTVL